MPFNYDAIIFDMDGTLVESETVWEEVEVEMFADRGIDYTDDARQQVVGMRLDSFFVKLSEIYNLTEPIDALEDELINRMLERIPSMVKAKPGADALIDYTKSLGIPYCIASSSPMSIINRVVETVGWEDDIPHRYTAHDVPHGKPAPDVYLFAAEKLNVAPERCLALEDSPNGARAAVAAGMTCFAVPDSHTNHGAFDDITPHVFDSLNDILNHLRG